MHVRFSFVIQSLTFAPEFNGDSELRAEQQWRRRHKISKVYSQAKLYLAGFQSGRGCNTYICGQPCQPDRTLQVIDQGVVRKQVHMQPAWYVVQAQLTGCDLHPRHYRFIATQLYERNDQKKNAQTKQKVIRSSLMRNSIPFSPLMNG